MSDRLPPIPTPSSQVWRQLRLQYLPVIVFVAGVVAAVVIWTRWVAPPTFVGEAEAVRAEIRSASPGAITGLEVNLLQPVRAGQVIGQVVTHAPQVIEASLGVVRAEIAMMRITLDPVVGQQRAAMDRERLLLDLLSKRVELVSLQGQLNQAQATFARTTTLHQTKMITDEQFEESRNARDSLDAQVKAQTELLRLVEPGMRSLDPENRAAQPSTADGLNAAIRHKEEELRLLAAQLGPVPLIAPIDGVVTLLHRRSGETVSAGEPILQISATQSKRIIGFLRQPLPLEPKPGMSVEIRTRSLVRRMGSATVAQVGQQLEPISPTILAAMRLPVSPLPTEFGLRIHITAPTGLELRPGEQVDVIVRD